MAHHHYPLQGTLRNSPFSHVEMADSKADPDHVLWLIYAFTRGMKGAETPTDDQGEDTVSLHGVPNVLWQALSDLLVGKDEAVT